VIVLCQPGIGFVVGFALCDRRLLPEQPLARPVMAAAAGIIGVGLRATHFYVEALFLAVAAIEVTYLMLELVAFAAWRLFRLNRRRPLAGTESVSA